MIRSSRLYGRRNEKRGEKKREGRLFSQNLWLRSLIIHFLMELYNVSYTHWHFRAVYLMVISIDFPISSCGIRANHLISLDRGLFKIKTIILQRIFTKMVMFLVHRFGCVSNHHFLAQQEHPVETSFILLGWLHSKCPRKVKQGSVMMGLR